MGRSSADYAVSFVVTEDALVSVSTSDTNSGSDGTVVMILGGLRMDSERLFRTCFPLILPVLIG